MEVRCRAIVSGRVQGVYYRATCKAVADELGVRGSVRNRADGTVEVVAEGERDHVDRLLAWCRDGPPAAIVTEIDLSDEPVGGETSFRIV